MTRQLMWYFIGIFFAASLGFYCGHKMHWYEAATARDMADHPAISAYFSPKGGCAEAVVSALGEAKSTVLVQAYSFTSDPISKALVDCRNRGVTVKVIMDRSQYDAKGAVAGPLFDAGIDVRMDSKHQIAHNKIMVIDGAVVVSGSYNFTRQAEIGNAENILIIRDAQLAMAYTANWTAHWTHSDVYKVDKAK